ncbi:hypothetical protein YP76_25365 [Sphingobium chungbukense]|uniref:Uncharacterized protein n=1 Tax=Sphingobium chungbukense TaxID=56193 RepID=A0A0M3ALH6_9SPHN|nr:hypothetical protein YP76_25365 [Sphingobium chungbukense]
MIAHGASRVGTKQKASSQVGLCVAVTAFSSEAHQGHGCAEKLEPLTSIYLLIDFLSQAAGHFHHGPVIAVGRPEKQRVVPRFLSGHGPALAAFVVLADQAAQIIGLSYAGSLSIGADDFDQVLRIADMDWF